MDGIKLMLRGLQAAQTRNYNRIAALQPSGELGLMVRDITLYGHRIAVQVTHIDTGTLIRSHRADFNPKGENGLPTGRVHISPNAINPKGKKPIDYGPHEHARGGSHAFYKIARGAAESYANARARGLISVVVRGGIR